jgi:nucleoid-associated protein YgaU
MGLFDFLKSAGKKLHLTEDAPQEAPPATATPEQLQAVKDAAERNKAAGLAKLVSDMGLGVDELGIRVDDDKVTVTGEAPSQEVKEKVVLLLGNVDGIAQVDDQLTVANPEPPATFYTVVSGDNLSHIAKHFYGNANLYPKIFEANRPMLKDPDEIYPGQVLRIPDASA